MVDDWDWQSVDWKTYEDAINYVQTDIEDAEKQINQLARDTELSDQAVDALASLASAVTNLAFLVTLHHRHIQELEGS